MLSCFGVSLHANLTHHHHRHQHQAMFRNQQKPKDASLHLIWPTRLMDCGLASERASELMLSDIAIFMYTCTALHIGGEISLFVLNHLHSIRAQHTLKVVLPIAESTQKSEKSKNSFGQDGRVRSRPSLGK